MRTPFVPACGALLAAAALARAQSLDLVPSYHPSGPVQPAAPGYAEVFVGEPARVELALPGLTHAQSQAVSGQWLSFVAFAANSLPSAIPISATAALWLDPSQLVIVPMPASLEAPVTPILPPGFSEAVLPTQAAFLELSNFALYSSGLFQLRILTPPDRHAGDRMLPLGASAAGASSVSFDAQNQWYRFRYQGGTDVVEYVIDMTNDSVAKGSLRVRELSSGMLALMDGGFYYAVGEGQVLLSPLQFQGFGTHTLVAQGISGNTLTMDWRDELPKLTGGTAVRHRRHEFTLLGRALRVHVKSLEPQGPAADTYFGVGLGNFGMADLSFVPMQQRQIPYMDQIGVTLVDQQWFHSAFIDLFASGASNHVPAEFATLDQYGHYSELMIYNKLSDGTLRPIDETGWLQVSRDVRDLFVASSAPASPYLPQLRQRIGVTMADEPENGSQFASDTIKLAQLRAFGFEDVFLLKQHWMNAGTNRRATTHGPPNPAGGSEAVFAGLVDEAVQSGWRTALYTDWYSLDQAEGHDDNPNYSETPGQELNFEDAVKRADGSYRDGFSLAVDPGVTGTPYYYTRVLAPRRAIKHWEREFTKTGEFYGSNAGYFDIACIAAPDQIVTANGTNVGGAISLDARSPSDASIRDAIDSYKSLFQHAGQRLQGPLVGEGSFVGFDARFDTFYGGYLDGFYRSLSTGGPPGLPQFSGQNQPVIPDYEWQVAREKLCGIGLGQYTRFFYSGAPGYSYPLGDVAIEEYRATEISYGHNGYFLTNSSLQSSGEYLSSAQQVKEYYTMHSLQHEWNNGGKLEIAYREATAGSPWMGLSDAIRAGHDFAHTVLRLSFESGLVIVVNHAAQTVQEGGYSLPTHGWTALNPNTGYQNLSVLSPVSGTRMDRVLAPSYELGDGNGTSLWLGGAVGMTTNLAVVRYDTGLVLIESVNNQIIVQ